jgi:hypothetical protein
MIEALLYSFVIVVGCGVPVWGAALFLWLQKRALIRTAKTYGIEYVPGEDLDRLKDRVVAKRDEGL